MFDLPAEVDGSVRSALLRIAPDHQLALDELVSLGHVDRLVEAGELRVARVVVDDLFRRVALRAAMAAWEASTGEPF